MYKFSKTSKERLETCHHDLQTLFNEVIKYIDCSIICGYRSREEQEKAVLDGKSKTHFPRSKHNSEPSMAVDVAPYPIDWSDNVRFYQFGGFVSGVATILKIQGKIKHSVRWGGDWDGDNDFKDQNFNDLVHFELIGV